MNNLDNVFGKILKTYESTKSIEDAIAVANLTDDQKLRVSQAFSALEEFDRKAKSLASAKKQGNSRKNWFAEDIMVTAEGKSIDDTMIEELFDVLAEESNKVSNEKFQKGE